VRFCHLYNPDFSSFRPEGIDRAREGMCPPPTVPPRECEWRNIPIRNAVAVRLAVWRRRRVGWEERQGAWSIGIGAGWVLSPPGCDRQCPRIDEVRSSLNAPSPCSRAAPRACELGGVSGEYTRLCCGGSRCLGGLAERYRVERPALGLRHGQRHAEVLFT
jgi:hypothetical protein